MARLLSSLYDTLLRHTSWLAFGPGTDPNKLVPIMAQYDSSPDWPRWLTVSGQAPFVIKRAFLDSLPDMNKLYPHPVQEVDNIRLHKLTHYKCTTEWHHEFVRADFIHTPTGKPLVAVWERDLPLVGPGQSKLRGKKIASGLPCDAVDRVSYVTEEAFKALVSIKKASKLRTATFTSPGPTILQVAAVLETHSCLFPAYHLYSTMCYWYADSTFEVLVDVSDSKVEVEIHDASRKGQWSYKSFQAVVYTGISRNKASVSMSDDTASYEQYLVNVQESLIRKFVGLKKKLPEKDFAELTEAERQSMMKNGWNVYQFIEIVKKMPKHDKLLATSKERAASVLVQLQAIQDGLEEATATERRKAEGELVAKSEADFAAKEAKWKAAYTSLQADHNELQKKDEENRKKIEELEKKVEEDRKKMEEDRKKMEEDRKKIEELKLKH